VLRLNIQQLDPDGIVYCTSPYSDEAAEPKERFQISRHEDQGTGSRVWAAPYFARSMTVMLTTTAGNAGLRATAPVVACQDS
jgi:hypothetical protein